MRLTKDSSYIEADTPILTRKGWKPIKNISKGTVIYNSRGHFTKVIHIEKAKQPFINYRVNFSDNNYIEGNSHLQFLAQNNYERQERYDAYYNHKEVINEAKIKEQLTSLPYYKFLTNETYQHYIDIEAKNFVKLYYLWETQRYDDYDSIFHWCPSIIPDPFTGRNIKIHPYLLGVWLSNGYRKDIIFRTRKKYILDKLKNLGYQPVHVKRNSVYRINKIKHHFRNLKLFEQKHIPDSYKYNTLENRWALLDGIRDGIGKKTTQQTKINLVDPVIYKDLCELLYTMNIKITKSSFTPAPVGSIVFKKRYSATFQYPSLEELLDREKYYLRQNIRRWTKVVSIKKSKQTNKFYGIVVSSADHAFLTGYSLIPTKDNYLKIDRRTISARK